ncbi:hypothetical protein FA95DRAFT_1555321 [Auriscalpium vulgare]|uniref:Uncharacterized protein n=1 Tax=Auriscalpium vulgare TaxID=40419 RepID=A0ACB8S3Z2_9AGAM|nr:hypothetical protein FA95DRAFT_1555321 [Auriscalpium vulgare]
MACFRRRRYTEEYWLGQHQHHHHGHRHHRRHALFTGFLLLAAFILYLLAALSLPIIKGIYLLQLNAVPSQVEPLTSIGTELRFGVWGFCVTSALNPPKLFSNSGDCVGPQLGYDIDPTILAQLTDETTGANVILKGLTVLLVLHPVAAALALLAFIPVFLSCCYFHTAPWVLSLIAAVATSIIGSVVLAADLALVIVARDKLKDVTLAHLTVGWGNAVWMIVVAVALSWLSVVVLSARVCRCCGYGRKYDTYTY